MRGLKPSCSKAADAHFSEFSLNVSRLQHRFLTVLLGMVH